VKAVLAGVRRTLGATPLYQKRAATHDVVLSMVAAGGGARSLRALRDRAILLFGFASAMRRSELVALDCRDIEDAPGGILVTLRRSKTDQEGVGRKLLVVRGETACPVEALKSWLSAAGIIEGPLFVRIWNKKAQRVSNQRLSPRNVAAIVKGAAARLGLDPASYGGHSLRAGFCTSAARRGANLNKIMDQTGHKSADMVRLPRACREIAGGTY
jgi:integrase